MFVLAARGQLNGVFRTVNLRPPDPINLAEEPIPPVTRRSMKRSRAGRSSAAWPPGLNPVLPKLCPHQGHGMAAPTLLEKALETSGRAEPTVGLYRDQT